MSDNTNKIFNTTVTLAVIPAYVYFCAFQYEQGYCDCFNVPTYLISPNLTTILVFATTIWTILFSALKVLSLSTPFFREIKEESKKHLQSILFVNGVLLVIIILMFYSYPFSWILVWVLLGLAFLINLLTWGFPFIYFFNRKKSVAQKIIDIQKFFSEDDVLSILFAKLNAKERLFVLVLILIPPLAYFIGAGQALKQTSFQILADKPNIVVLKKYDNMFICSPYDKKTKILKDSLILIKADESKYLVLRTVKIGKLHTK